MNWAEDAAHALDEGLEHAQRVIEALVVQNRERQVAGEREQPDAMWIHHTGRSFDDPAVDALRLLGVGLEQDLGQAASRLQRVVARLVVEGIDEPAVDALGFAVPPLLLETLAQGHARADARS